MNLLCMCSCVLFCFFLKVFTHDFMAVVFFVKSVSFTEGKLWDCNFSLKVQNPEVKKYITSILR